MLSRDLTVEQLQHTDYNELSIHDVELFDLGTKAGYLEANFTIGEFAFAAGLVLTD